MARKKFKVKVPKSTHWYFTIIVKELIYLTQYHFRDLALTAGAL